MSRITPASPCPSRCTPPASYAPTIASRFCAASRLRSVSLRRGEPLRRRSRGGSGSSSTKPILRIGFCPVRVVLIRCLLPHMLTSIVGWTYYLRAGLELYNMPYPELVNTLRAALRDLWKRGTIQEKRWTAVSLGKGDGSRTRPTSPGQQKRTSHTNRSATTEQAYFQHGQKNRQRNEKRLNSPVLDLLPDTPDFDPFPAVRGTREAPAFTGSTSTASAMPIDPKSQNIVQQAALPNEPDFDPFPNARHTPSAATSPLARRAFPAAGSPRNAAIESTSPPRSMSTRQKTPSYESDSHAMTTDSARPSTTPQVNSYPGESRDPASLDALAAVPDFDPFSAERGVLSTSRIFSTETVVPLNLDSQSVVRQAPLPTDPDFDPFPTVRASTVTMPIYLKPKGSKTAPTVLPRAEQNSSTVPESAGVGSSGLADVPLSTSKPSPTLKPKAKTKLPEAVDWWAVGRKIEAAIGHGQSEEGSTRWDTPKSAQVDAARAPVAEKESEKERASTQSRLAGMLYQRNEVVRPDSQERLARRIPWQTHRLEEK
ncbi:hypothetical protein B0H12DRAFT_39768 [Mycena haematopus]|nr:hypothetical protein B0H12DRAFT_39768 [Mycena haematopus]